MLGPLCESSSVLASVGPHGRYYIYVTLHLYFTRGASRGGFRMGSALFHEPLQIELLGGYTDPCLVRILKVLGVRDMHLELLGIVVDPAPGGPPVRPPQPERTCFDEELAPRVPPVLSLFEDSSCP